MRAVTIVLAAIPVVFGGLGIAAVAGGLDQLSPLSPTAEETPLSPEDAGSNPGVSPGDQTTEATTGTKIDGRRPHLTVVEGHGDAMAAMFIPALLSVLPAANIELAPLPLSNPFDAAPRAPLSAQLPVPASSPVPPVNSPRPPVVNFPPAASQPPQIGGHSGWEAPPAIIDNPGRDLMATGGDRDSTVPSGPGNPGRPAHAGIPGPPPHAGTTGPPPHARNQGPPSREAHYDTSDNSGPGNRSANGNGNGNQGNQGNQGNGNGRPGQK